MPNLPNKPHQLLFALFLAAGCWLLAADPVLAENLTSQDYVVKMGSIIIGGGKKTGNTTKVIDPVDQISSGQFETSGFRLQNGFTYVKQKEPFSFAISANNVDLNNLIANTFSRSQSTLVVDGSGIHGYRVLVIEDHVLRNEDGQATIPDTTCNSTQKCTPAKAAPWTASLAYGFGYNITGTDTNQSEFIDTTYFRPFPSNEAKENPTVIMSRTGAGGKAEAVITYQTNISPNQPNGAYKNSVQFIALPSY